MLIKATHTNLRKIKNFSQNNSHYLLYTLSSKFLLLHSTKVGLKSLKPEINEKIKRLHSHYFSYIKLLDPKHPLIYFFSIKNKK